MAVIDEQVTQATYHIRNAANYLDAVSAELQRTIAVLRVMNPGGAPNVVKVGVPWLSQLGPEAAYSNSDCGPACVTMLARWLGKSVTVDQMSQATGLARGYTGTLPAHLIKAGAAYGVKLQRTLNISIGQLREWVNAGAPALVLVHYASLPKRYDQRFQSGHWIVVCGCTSNARMLYHDPYWPDTTGQYLDIADGELEKAMRDCEIDRNTARQGLTFVAAAG
jgi:hypothetical protein